MAKTLPETRPCPGPCGEGNGWIQYRLHVVSTLEAHSKALASIVAAQQQIREDLRALKVKAAFFCVIVAAVVSVAVEMLTR